MKEIELKPGVSVFILNHCIFGDGECDSHDLVGVFTSYDKAADAIAAANLNGLKGELWEDHQPAGDRWFEIDEEVVQ